MLVSHRSTHVASIRASLATHAVVHSAFRLHVVHNEGIVSEDRLSLRAFERKGHLDRPMATTILAGRARVEIDGREHWLEAGDVLFLPSKDGVRMRQEGERFASVALEWAAGSIGGGVRSAGVVRLDARAREAIAAAAGAIARDAPSSLASAPGDPSDAVSAVLGAVRAVGGPIDRWTRADLREEVPEAMRRVGRALDETLSNLDGRPMVVDLDRALDLSSRQVQRVVREFNARYGFNAAGWRDTLNRRRTLVGAALMTARGATTESIARAMGYGSPATFCRAMAAAGLPSPGAIARLVQGLL